ncbi:hypothetical protein GCM10028808_30630 [Spirosoma migulaei]
MNRFFTPFLVCFLGVCTICPAQKFQVDTLQKTGPLNRRINVVLLGDGFSQSELPKFDQEAKKFMAFFLSYSPYNAYTNYFNFFSIRVPSKESGATNPGTAPDRDPSQPVETKDTYFGSSFGTANINRLVAIKNYQAFTNVMATNFPSYDLAVMIVNSPYYGGSGGNPATFTLNVQANLIGAHEIGHIFSSLTDEYWAGLVYAHEAANMTRINTPSSVIWKNWLNQFNVGIFPHTGESTASGWYKPTTGNCLMELLSKPFCAVCQEATTNKILQVVKPVENVQPLPDSRITINEQPETFRLTLLKPNPNTLNVEWRLNDVPIKLDSGNVTITNSQLTTLVSTLSVSVFDSTTYIRSESHRQQHTYTYRWTLEKAILAQTVAITSSKSSLCMGESATLTAANCAGSISWSTGATSTTISVSPTQSTTYSVLCNGTDASSQTAAINLSVFPLPVAEVSNTGPYVEGQSIQLMAKGGTNYTWMGPANFTSVEQNPVISFAKITQAGTYTVVVTSATGCMSKAQTTVTISPLLARTNASAESVWVFPNPSKNRIQIQATLTGELEFTLLDATGHEVAKKSFFRTTELPIDHLPKAVYFYRVGNDQQQLTGKLIVD